MKLLKSIVRSNHELKVSALRRTHRTKFVTEISKNRVEGKDVDKTAVDGVEFVESSSFDEDYENYVKALMIEKLIQPFIGES